MAITEKDITIAGHGSGNPSTKNMYTYNSNRYASKASNGLRKGVVAVRRLKKLTDAKRKEYQSMYRSILGRNYYNQNLRDYVYNKYKDGNYYSDCSSSICATYRQIGYTEVPMLNTAGIYENSLFETVPVVIKNGHIMNPEILKVGDCILYVGSDPKRPLQIGHVETVYKMPDTKTDWERQSDGSWKYLLNGSYVKDKWLEIKNRWYAFDGSGKMITGWFESKKKWYYLNPIDGTMLSRQWIKYKGDDYYLGDDGAMVTNCYVQAADKKNYYWIGNDGKWDSGYDTANPPKGVKVVKK